MAITFGNGAPGIQFTETNNSFYRAPVDDTVKSAIFIESPYGPVNTPVLVSSTKDLINTFGIPSTGPSEGNNSAYPYISQEEVLNNMSLYVVRVGGTSGSASTLTVTSPAQWNNVFSSKYIGSGQNEIQVSNDSTNTKLNVYFMGNLIETYDYYQKETKLQMDINQNSKYLTVNDDSQLQNALSTDLPVTNLSGGQDYTIQSTDVVNSITNCGLDNTDAYKINYILTSGWAQVLPTDYNSVYAQMLSLQTTRKDCMVLGEPPLNTDVNDVQTNTISLSSDAGYSAVYYPWVKKYDPISGGIIYMPPSVQVTYIFSNIDKGGKVWIAPQGKLRGGISQIGLERKLTKSDMDTLYSQGINPIVDFISDGIFVWGQKTHTTVRSQLDRINQRKTAIYIEQHVIDISKGFLFEDYTQSILNEYTKEVKTFMDGLKSQGQIYDYIWSLDDNPELVDQNMVVQSLAFKPVKTIEYIKINFQITAYSQSFNEQ